MLSQTRAQLDAALAEYRSLSRRINRMRDELASLTAVGRSDDGCARATVNAWGELIGLAFDPSAVHRLEPSVLAARVVSAAQSAAAEARERKQALISGLLPGGLRHLVAEDGLAGLRRLLGDDETDVATPSGRSR